MELLKKLVKNRWFQIFAALAVGVAVGTVFYPSRTSEEEIRTSVESKYKKKISELRSEHENRLEKTRSTLDELQNKFARYKRTKSRELESLRRENSRLTESTKRRTVKVVKPDGTIIEKEYEESNKEEVTEIVTKVRREFKEKVSSIEDKWKRVHKKRVKDIRDKYTKKIEKIKQEQDTKIVERVKKKIVKVNERKFRPEIGVSSDKKLHLHGTYSVWGPVFVGGGITGSAGVLNSESSFDRVIMGVGVEL